MTRWAHDREARGILCATVAKSRHGASNPTARSEGESSRQLNLAVAVLLNTFNLAEVAAVLSRRKVPVGAGIRVGEFRGVEDVESISVQFQRVPLGGGFSGD